jgi:hypothetical protein
VVVDATVVLQGHTIEIDLLPKARHALPPQKFLAVVTWQEDLSTEKGDNAHLFTTLPRTQAVP